MADSKEPTGGSAPARGAAGASHPDEAGSEHESELDHELLSLRGPRPRIGALLSLSIVSLCAYLMVQIWPDLRFALRDDEPQPVADPAEATSLSPERYVEIDALALDRAAALRVSHSADPGLATGQRVAPAVGTEGAVWVAVHGNPRLAPVRRGETHAGRLRALDDVPFADSLREHAHAFGAPRFTTGAALREALEGGIDSMRTPAGDSIVVDAATPVAVAETVVDEVEITAVATDARPSAESWAEALTDVGALPALRPPVAAGDDIWVFAADGDAEAIGAALAEARLIGAHAEQVQRVHETAFGELAAAGDELRAGDERVPWASIDGVWLEVTTQVDDDAMILLAGERPDDYRLVPWMFAGLVVFALVFAWALADGIRREVVAHRVSQPPEKPVTEKT